MALSMAADYEVRDVDFYHRAVLKPAPTCFTVEVLPPVKQGKAHSYGIRVIPVNPKTIEALDKDNDSVKSLDREYEIWRKWDDCLDFQDRIELEYERMSREKKRGLFVGNGAKRSKANGFYANTQAASSFESLPEGPDPKSIAVDVHSYIPRLSKKTSVFKVSDATVQKRGEEFAALIYALFKADCPRLIMELRDTPNIRDFFGWWRRDKELWEKKPKRPSTADSRISISESTISLNTPPSPDSPGFSILKSPVKPQIHRSPSDAVKSPTSPSRNGRETPTMDRELDRAVLPSPPTSPEAIGAKLQRSRSPMAFLRPGSRDPKPLISRPLALPLQDVSASFGRDGLLSPPADPRRANVRSRSPAGANRTGRLFDPREAEHLRAQRAADVSSDDSATPPATPTQDRPISTITMDSSYDIDLSFLGSAPGGRYSKRDSVASFASVDSVGTTCSADAVVPRGPRHRMRRGLSPWEPDVRVSMVVPEEEELDEFFDDTSTIDGVSMYDDASSYLGKLDSFPGVPGLRGQFEDDGDSIVDRRMSFPASICEGDNEATYMPTIVAPSESGHSHESVSGATCSIKAKYDECIVAVRISMDTSLTVLRNRLVEKFSHVQGIRLRPRFGLAYTPLTRLSDDSMPIVLSPSPYASFSTNGPDRRPGTPDSVFGSVLTRLVPIWNQDDWELALDSCNGKLVLHILDTEVW